MITTTRPTEFCPGCGHRLYRQEGKAAYVVVNGNSHIRYSLNHLTVTCLQPISRADPSQKCRTVMELSLDNQPGSVVT